MYKKSNMIIVLSFCCLGSNSLYGMEMLKSIFCGKPIRRETVTEEKEFHDLNACKEYMRGLGKDVNKSGAQGIVKIFYKKPESDEHCETAAWVDAYTTDLDNPKCAISNPLSFEQQLDDQFKRQNLDLAQQQSVSIQVSMRYDQVIKPS